MIPGSPRRCAPRDDESFSGEDQTILTPSPDDPKIWFPSTESFAWVLTEKNRDLLRTISQTHPDSLETLAQSTGRAPSNLSRTLKTMAHYGFVELHKGTRGRVRPEVPYQAITLELALG